jgi:hypothetical protein
MKITVKTKLFLNMWVAAKLGTEGVPGVLILPLAWLK